MRVFETIVYASLELERNLSYMAALEEGLVAWQSCSEPEGIQCSVPGMMRQEQRSDTDLVMNLELLYNHLLLRHETTNEMSTHRLPLCRSSKRLAGMSTLTSIKTDGLGKPLSPFKIPRIWLVTRVKRALLVTLSSHICFRV
jgi:hypothetical protein